MLTGHLAHSLLHTLADLDGEQKLLGISALLKTTKTTAIESHIKHPLGLAAVLLSQCALTYLVSIDTVCSGSQNEVNTTQVRYLMLRSVGTLVVNFHMQDRHNQTSRERTTNANLGFLYQAIGSPRKLRKDISLGVAYNGAYLVMHYLLSSVSSSPIWNMTSEIVIGVFLANLHIHWTCIILLTKRQAGSRIVSLPHRNMILPCALYILAWKLVSTLPETISRALSAEDAGKQGDFQTIALVDAIVLFTTLSLRLLVFYPAYATYIHNEIKQVRSTDAAASGRQAFAKWTNSFGLELESYCKTARTCFRRTTLWFALLHLQTVLILAIIEILTAPILHKLVF